MVDLKLKKNLSESIRQRLKNLSEKRKRPFDELLRYYAIERFLYRLSISDYKERFFLKGGLMLKVWDSINHRATMDIDLLAHTSNQLDNLRHIISEVAAIHCEEDAINYDCQELILRETQVGGEYQGVRASFFARLFKTRIPVLVDIGFNDVIIPKACRIFYPSLLEMSRPRLMGYTSETVVAEKFESIVKLGLVNTRMKDFFDLWMIFRWEELSSERLRNAIQQVFSNRGTKLKYPSAFTKTFYESPVNMKRWENFLSMMGKDQVEFKAVIEEIESRMKPIIEKLDSS